MLSNLPNAITISRLLVVPFMVWLLIEGSHVAAFWVFLIAGISDALDGFIAKRFNAASDLGSYLDPLADKALLVSVYVTLGVQGGVAHWLVILVVFRDLLILAGAVLYYTMAQQALAPDPHPISKLNTAAQIVLVVLILGGQAFGVDFGVFKTIMVFFVGISTLLSGAVYMVRWFRTMALMK